MTLPSIPPTVPWMTSEATNLVSYEGGLPTLIGTYITYGPFVFPTAIDLKVQVEPVYDASGILPKWYKHTFTLETVISPHNSPGQDDTGTQTLDLNESQFRRNLAIPGQEFRIYAKGIGQNQRIDDDSPVGPITSAPANNRNQDPIIENPAGTGKANDIGTLMFLVEQGFDLNFGPKPVVQLLEPIGSSRIYRLVWSVEICLPICCVQYQLNPATSTPYFCLTPQNFTSQTKYDFSLTEFTYSVSWSADEEGYTVRTVIGSAEVAGRLFQDLAHGSGNVSTQGPRYWTDIIDRSRVKTLVTTTFPMLQGFTRSIQDDISRDGKRLEWRIVDREIRSETPYYQGVIKCEAKASLKNTDGLGFTNYDFAISGSFTVLPGVRKWNAYLAFLTILRSRMQTLLQNAQIQFQLNNGNMLPGLSTYLPMGHEYEEDILGRTCTFTFRYRVISNLQRVLFATNMFKPVTVPGWTWASWLNSLPSYLRDGTGSTDTSLVQRRNLMGTCNTLEGSRADTTTVPRESPPPPEPYFVPVCPTPDKSWMEYRNWYTLYDEKEAVQHTPSYKIPETYYTDPPPDYYTPTINAFPPGAAPGYNKAANTLGAASPAYPVFQGLGVGKYHIRMTGFAIRLCGQVRAPSLYSVRTVGGQNLQPQQVASQVVLDRVIGQYGPIRMVLSTWDILYTIQRPPDAGTNFILGLVTDAEGERYISQFDPRGTDQILNGLAQIPT